MDYFITLGEYACKSESLKLMAEDTEYFPISFIHPGCSDTLSPTCHIMNIIYPIKEHTRPGLSINNKKGVTDIATRSAKTLLDKIDR